MKENINISGSDFPKFILEHDGCDTDRLLFSAGKYPGIDIKLAAATIEARKRIKSKVPLWFGFPQLIYPTSLSLEQCSSQRTAIYKRSFVPEGGRTADITGGLGIDCYFMSRNASHTYYCERNELLAEAAKHNFEALQADNIVVTNCDSRVFIENAIESGEHFDLIYADPARRSASASRIYSITDCEPDIVELKRNLFDVTDRILIKVSPMADISHTAALLPECVQIHIVSVDNECKELLLLLKKDHCETPLITAACLSSKGRRESLFIFRAEQEKEAGTMMTSELGRYIYIPDKAILKAGAFNLISRRFGIKKLAPSTHLYTSDNFNEEFPGKIREIREVIPFSKTAIQEIAWRHPQIDPVAVNFPMDTAHLKKRLKTKDGGNEKLIATTLCNREKVLIIC